MNTGESPWSESGRWLWGNNNPLHPIDAGQLVVVARERVRFLWSWNRGWGGSGEQASRVRPKRRAQSGKLIKISLSLLACDSQVHVRRAVQAWAVGR
eukprot:scaffold3767_cov114-Isochrysis_galbana.AAC.36